MQVVFAAHFFMATTKFYLDKRAVKSDSPAPLKVCVVHQGKTILINLNLKLLPEQWDARRQVVVVHSQKHELNRLIASKKMLIDEWLHNSMREGVLETLTPSCVADTLRAVLDPSKSVRKNTVAACMLKAMELKRGRTAQLYGETLDRLRRYDADFDSRTFEDIDVLWLQRWEAWLERFMPSANSRSIHLRNLRAVFNHAIDWGLTSNYPFRRFKIKHEATRKRALSVEGLRLLAAAELPEWMCKYRDLFMLDFMLIGTNYVDLCSLKGIEDGRVNFRRAKTHRLYSIKVEPEALELINRLRGKGQLLWMLDRNENYRTSAMTFDRAIKAIAELLGLPALSSYWARHSWATIAASLDIPKETIAAALGHGGNTVTDVYIDFDRRKVDEANRRVLDWVLYKKI